MTSPGDNDNVEPDLAAPLLEAQSSFAENDQAAAGYKTEPAKFDPEDLRDDIMDDDAEIDALQLMFECPIKNLVEFTDRKGVPQRRNQEDKMNDIVLYIQDESDFYQAWENVFRGEVPDYQNDEDGDRYKASQTTWIERLPDILTFQMQRTKFVDGNFMKMQHKHAIQTEIYPDRFMYSNRAEVEALRKKVASLRSKITFLRDCLKKYTNFNSSGISLEDSFTQTLHFFAAQGQEQVPQTDLDASEMGDIEVHLPLKQDPIDSNLVQQVLDNYRNKVKD